MLPNVLSVEMCHQLRAPDDDPACFRSGIVMQRHGFGRGERYRTGIIFHDAT